MNGFILHLQGPMMSFGDTGFGQLRDAGPGPSRSAILGVLAGALGIERGGERLLDLHREIRVHVGAVSTGTLLVDYHTIATSGYAEHDPARLRRGPIPGKNPVLTSRSYHMDAHFVAFLTGVDSDLLDECRRALRNPVFTGYLGRRSCPPSTPLIPFDAEGERIDDVLGAAVLAARRHRTKALPPWKRAGRETFDAYLDADGLGSISKEEAKIVARSSRRDLLVALPRTYVNRPVLHVRIPIADRPSLTNQEIFDAAS